MLRSRSRFQLEDGPVVGSGRGDTKRLAAAAHKTKAQLVRRSRASGAENATATSAKLRETAVAPAGVLGDITNTADAAAEANGPMKSTLGLLSKTTIEIAGEPPGSNAVGEVNDTISGSIPLNPLLALEVDVAHEEDPQHVMEYVPDIYLALRRGELLHRPDLGYMSQQPHINSSMRGILIDWLVDVHRKYDLSPETLFLCVSLVDRYLTTKAVLRWQLQLVGIAALFIASKYEDRYPPQIDDLIYVTDRAYTANQLVQMEISMLSTLDFQICTPTPQHFLERFQQVNACSKMHCSVSSFLLELALIDHKMVQYAPSFLAAVAIFLSNKLVSRRPAWTEALVEHTKYDERSLRGCAKDLCALLECSEQSKLQAIRKKYSHEKHHAVAKLTFPLNRSVAAAVHSR